MSDKKIVDDYYSQAKEQLSGDIGADKKPKIQIKWKIKVKKDSPKEESSVISEQKNDREELIKKQHIVKDQNPQPKKESTETQISQTTIKKEYFTKSGAEKQANNFQKPRFENKKSFNNEEIRN